MSEPMGYSLPGSSVHGILQARILEWVALPSSTGPSQPRGETHISYVSCIADRLILYHWTTGEALFTGYKVEITKPREDVAIWLCND